MTPGRLIGRAADAGEESTLAGSPSSPSSLASTNAVSENEDAAASSSKSVGDLPDLNDKLLEQGAYEQYLQWQQDYRHWRSGGARGSTGELTELTGDATQLPAGSAASSSNDVGDLFSVVLPASVGKDSVRSANIAPKQAWAA